jgi:hypothetical protein
MFRRETPAQFGDYMRRALEPMALSLGVEYEESFFGPPVTDQARVFDAYRCGLSLVMAFTYPDGWANASSEKRLARKAAKALRAALLTPSGQDAISHMTQGYAHEMADFWRRAESGSDDPTEAAGLQESAARSDALGVLAGQCWPVNDPFGALDHIALAESHRTVDVDNPDAMIDLRSYFGRARVACGAAALALGADVATYSGLLYMPVAFLDLMFATGLQSDWEFQLEIWANLLRDHRRPYAEFMALP